MVVVMGRRVFYSTSIETARRRCVVSSFLRFVASRFVFVADEEFFNFFPSVQFTRNLRRMSLRKRVSITNESETYEVVVRSPNADVGNVASASGADPRTRALGYRGARRRDDADDADAPTTPTTREAVDLAHARARAALGVAEGWREMEGAMPLECNLDELRGVSFTKGCYVGQENTARQRFRGATRKRVTPFAIRGSNVPSIERGTKIVNERGDVVGEVLMTSAPSAAAAEEEETLGLARARVEFIRERVANAPGSIMRVIDGPEIDVRVPEWWPERFLFDEDGGAA